MDSNELPQNISQSPPPQIAPQKNSILFLFLGGIAILIIGIIGGFYLRNYLNQFVDMKPSSLLTPTSNPTESNSLETVELKTYTNDEVGFSFKYPNEIPIVEHYDDVASTIVSISVYIDKVEDLANDSPFNYKDMALSDINSLANGEYGDDHGIPNTYFKEVIPLSDTINAKTFAFFDGITCESVYFNRALIFYKDGYKVHINITADTEKMKQYYKEYFVDSSECAPGTLIWKENNTFVEDLESKKISGPAMEWMSVFDKVVSTIKLTEDK